MITYECILNPRESGDFVSRNAAHITCNASGIQKVSELIYKGISEQGFSKNIWQGHELNPKSANQETIDWIFLVDTLNFSFWPDEGSEKFGVKDHNGKLQTGYWSLCASINRALNVGIPITSAEFMSNITLEQLETIFRSDTGGKIPLLKERLDAINNAGKVLLEKFSGSFKTCIMKAEKDVNKLLDIIVDNFESYRDICTYNNKTVSFLKRAQILIADIWTCFNGSGLGEFHNINELTMFADYRVPQALVALNALQYSDKLRMILKSKRAISSGDTIECEIRGMSIYACDLIQQSVHDLAILEGVSINVNAVIVDYFLWQWARDNRSTIEELPFHKTRCIYY